MLRDVEGLTTGEVADVLGIGTSTVRVTIHRARRRIRDALGPRRLMEACV
jgi:DNA-directed RNA polymerase specialized sigma24 family protein